MLFRVELIDLSVIAVVWCAVKKSWDLSTKRSTVAESLCALGAREPHERGTDKQRAFQAGRCALAVDRDLDVNLAWRVIKVRQFHFPKILGARPCIDEPVPLIRHG